ncbi:TetR/AcrR family transcriptional regulator [Tersicoccus sp. MR15.9]|uniref:TetR/AcrR family transcriptional regulator n=1 Tax=Tersicoccus mangrovi TaxID=3121635 RepID=UPI002FE5C315
MARSTYRHGDLHRALIDAGLQLARESGPDAVVLRETTRKAQVAASAAYRHFADRDALVHAVSMAAQAHLAEAIEQAQAAELAKLPDDADDVARSRALLRSVGAGYLGFAWAEPGWFRTAFWVHEDLRDAAAPMAAGPAGKTPFQMLGHALDAMVEAGVLPADQRRGAEVLAWSTVHGMATLTIDGPLRVIDAATRLVLAERLLSMVERGL